MEVIQTIADFALGCCIVMPLIS